MIFFQNIMFFFLVSVDARHALNLCGVSLQRCVKLVAVSSQSDVFPRLWSRCCRPSRSLAEASTIQVFSGVCFRIQHEEWRNSFSAALRASSIKRRGPK